MQMVFHMGVHGTDGDRLLKTLLDNKARLQMAGTEVVPPERHKSVFDDALRSLDGGTATPEMEEIMLDAILDSDHPSRVVMSTWTFQGAPGRAVGRTGLYPKIGARTAALAQLFPSAQTEFFLAIRNPATLLAEVLPQFSGNGYDDLMQGCHPLELRWRDAIHRLLQAAQGRRVVLWCHEDVPLIWPEVVRLTGDLPHDVPLTGGLGFLQDLLDDKGIAALRETMADRDQMDIAQRRRLHADLLRDHALPDSLDQEIDLPGWTQDLVDQVTETYRSDVAEIAVLPGVEFILP
ncbi:hypothetical protein FA743_02680 [Paracoccus gahaiensis]|uniref:Sulfotransferase family protein n=1 Tax=Paracoccus gahaiensis TaxID=1706839 RepID=A0A4U0RFC5_9RHOB|nr:hypothetical protein [Paracoccus gahaiensis]TJZ94183.1 hypothetical protein FA743_02680 [Paracoccus gahaiensis]